MRGLPPDAVKSVVPGMSPLMDILFGTYRCPDHEPERLGTDEPPRSYLGHMFGPFVPTETESRSAAEAAAGIVINYAVEFSEWAMTPWQRAKNN